MYIPLPGCVPTLPFSSISHQMEAASVWQSTSNAVSQELLGKSEQWEDFHILQPPEVLPAILLQLSPLRVLNPSSPPL